MSKQGEIEYLKNLEEKTWKIAVTMPFSDENCHSQLFRIGAIMRLLPPPSARLLDLGCGTGWTSAWYAKRGYQVVGVDIAPDMLQQANIGKEKNGLDNLSFVECDYESMNFREEFDCAVFFSSLHHAENEQVAISACFAALKPGGVCITSEPGEGHAQASYSKSAVDTYNVTEKDMPPKRILELGKKAGFREFNIFPNVEDLWPTVYPGKRWNIKKFYHRIRIYRKFCRRLRRFENRGIVLMIK